MKYCNEHLCVCVCVSVCLSVCLSIFVSVCLRACLSNYMHDLYQFFVHVAYGRGSVLRKSDEISRGRANFVGLLH